LPDPEVLVAAVQPVVDPATVRLVGDGCAVPQLAELCLSVSNGVEDFGERDVSAARP
jgi:hypothetical protein